MNECLIPIAPPNYQKFDVVEEFQKKFYCRQAALQEQFDKKRTELEFQFKMDLEELKREEDESLSQLNVLFLEWIKQEPNGYNNINRTVQTQDDNFNYWKWILFWK